jgi:peptidoglycan/LPS O-acetylase OafA/YrhL
MKFLGDLSKDRNNNLKLIRFIAATMVMIAHSYVLTGRSELQDPMYELVGVGSAFVAVNSFFVLSGFLVARSFERSRTFLDYFESRFLRIFPGLFVSLLFCSLVMGGLATSWPLDKYFSDSAVWKFLAVNSTLIIDKVQLRYFLPGVFANNPYPRTINGSLWTLPYEVWLYVLLGGLGLVGILKRRWVMNSLFVLSLAFCLIIGSLAGGDIFYMKLHNLERFCICFLTGTVFYCNRAIIPLSIFIVIGLIALTAIFGGTGLYNIPFILTLSYLIFWLAYIPSGRIRLYNKAGDFSYGVYIYGFPVQQSVVALFGIMEPILFFSCAFAITLACAIPSWHFIEKPALARKGTLVKLLQHLHLAFQKKSKD